MSNRGLDAYSRHFGRALPEVERDLESFAALLLKWNAVQNLVSRETEGALWSRHILDSLQLLPLVPGAARSFLDLGSGGGFPALPLAIALKGGPAQLLLVEPIQKKVSFLRTVIRELQLPARVESRRIEAIDSRETGPIDVITSRALAPLSLLFSLSQRFFGDSTVALFHKGEEHVEELQESGSAWDFDVVVTRSATDERGVVLQIRNLRPKPTR